MEVFHDLTGNIMCDLQGRIMAKNPIPSIDLEHENQFFPPLWSANDMRGNTGFRTQGENEIFIDFGDGSPIYTEIFSDNLQFNSGTLYEYNTIERRTVRIWFKYPERINEVRFYWQRYIGNFPLNLGLYNLNLLGISQTRFDAFPINFLGGVFNRIIIRTITQQTIYSIPAWIINSRIQNLSLHGGIELDNDATDSIEKLMDIEDLETLSLSDTKITDIPSSFKDKDTLRRLFLGSNPFTEITTNVNDCKQLTELSFGYHPNYWTAEGSNLFTAWGIGIANMPELQVFRFDGMFEAPDTLPTGIETAPKCKTIWARISSRTQQRQDTFIENVYNQVVSIASMATGEGVLRRTTLRIERYGFGASTTILRPSGVYQAPIGYVQGSSNGTPASPMEMIYVLVNQYEWTLYVTDEAGTGTQILTH